jgi:predicted RNase H-like HicB family nuclease
MGGPLRDLKFFNQVTIDPIAHTLRAKSWEQVPAFLDEGVHGQVLDFPGVITFGETLDETRRLLASALTDMAETNLMLGESLPQPNPNVTDADADLEELILA